MTKLVDLYEEGSITNDETGWFMWRSSITNDETGWFIWRFDNKWRNWLIYVKKVYDETGWFMEEVR